MLEDKGSPYYCPMCLKEIRSIDAEIVRHYYKSEELSHICPQSPWADKEVRLCKKKDLEDMARFIRLCLGTI